MSGDAKGVVGPKPARLRLRLLGAVEVTLDGRPVRGFDSLRFQRFLALLAVRRAPQPRALLAFELWPESEESQARTNLRKLIHDLRRVLPGVEDFMEIDGDSIRLIPAAVEIDVWAFHDAVAAGDLDSAVSCYGGDFIPACYDDWASEERARLRDDAHGALVRGAEEAASIGDHHAVVRHARRILDLVPTDEFAFCAQMEAHVALGDRAAALRVYHRCVDVLERELAVAPGDAIVEVYRQLRGSGSAVIEPDVEAADPVESPFVGRDRELEQLAEVWDRCRGGRAHLVVVTGEAGIGKSRLALELNRRVRAAGHLVASARAYEAAGRLPWGPVVDLLRDDALSTDLHALDDVWRSELARLLPELVETAPAERPASSGDRAPRHRLFDAAARALVGDRPRLLVIDDLQWCDAETIELIGFIMRTHARAPVLVVGTARSEEMAGHQPLEELLGALGRDRAVTTIPLDRLDEDTTAALAARLAPGESVGPELAARLWSETEGNPLFVVEAMRAGISLDRAQTVLTPTVRSVLLERLAQLSDDARRLADVAAVIGRPFSDDLVGDVAEIGEVELVESLDELWRRRIIRDQGHTYDFTHDKLRAIALETVSPARRRRLHRAVAIALAAESGPDTGAASAQVAAHYDQAGMVGPAIDAYRRAGARASAVSALDEAVAMYRRALALLAELSPSDDRDALELDIRIALGSPLVALDGYGSKDAHQLYERALALCRRLRRPVDPPVLRGLGLARLQGCRFDECTDLGRALLDHESVDPVVRTEGRYLLGVSAFWQGDLGAARHHLQNAIDTYDGSHRDRHLESYAQDPLAVCMVRLALVELWEGDPTRADETVRSALGVAEDLDHLMTWWYVITYGAVVAAESDDFTRLAELLADADRLSERLAMDYLMIVLDALRGWMETSDGVPDAIEAVERSVARSRAEGETLHLTYCLLLLARARGGLGRIGAGRAAAADALSWTQATGQHYLEAELWRADGELAARQGDGQDAATSLGRAVEVAESQGAKWLESRARESLARAFPEGK